MGRYARKERPVDEPRLASGGLTEEQRTRVDIARGELEHARRLDLVAMRPADLVRAVEKLRGSLHDVLSVVHELTEARHPPSHL